jgi:hypothetical protein
VPFCIAGRHRAFMLNPALSPQGPTKGRGGRTARDWQPANDCVRASRPEQIKCRANFLAKPLICFKRPLALRKWG